MNKKMPSIKKDIEKARMQSHIEKVIIIRGSNGGFFVETFNDTFKNDVGKYIIADKVMLQNKFKQILIEM
jgi:hypothetical protein